MAIDLSKRLAPVVHDSGRHLPDIDELFADAGDCARV
jgi:hypothetical protein